MRFEILKGLIEEARIRAGEKVPYLSTKAQRRWAKSLVRLGPKYLLAGGGREKWKPIKEAL